ncbi:MAG TPA: quinoprotein dehydrogenase-associated SoxYZ-like carrier [Burkholderiaceae bacterium]|nr:quinoprotein dehydrogenase-associated SoxYZ-like carrier [Burkholderiaceae bacterium]
MVKGLYMSRRGVLALTAASLTGTAAQAQLKSGDDPEASPRWQQVRASLFKGRTLNGNAGDVITLDAPGRAEDAAIVPIVIRARFEQKPERHIKQVHLIIDNNPSPVSAIFTYTLDSGRADIETRVRIDEYTFVRAIAETNDGQLYMATRFVKAAGGCSAPPGKDAVAARATLGQMRLRVQGAAATGSPVLAQLMISHPNDSGLVMDQLTRQYTPPHFVRRIDVSVGGRRVLSADLDFSISENPNLRFYFVPRDDGGTMEAVVVDSNELRFQQTLAYRSSP